MPPSRQGARIASARALTKFEPAIEKQKLVRAQPGRSLTVPVWRRSTPTGWSRLCTKVAPGNRLPRPWPTERGEPQESFLPSCLRLLSVCTSRALCSTSLRCMVSSSRRSGALVLAAGVPGTAPLTILPSIKFPRRQECTSLGFNQKEVPFCRSTVRADVFIPQHVSSLLLVNLLFRRLHICLQMQQCLFPKEGAGEA